MRLFPGKKRRRFYLALLAALFLAVIADQVWIWAVHGISISHDTTRITSPVVAGYPDYLAAINQAYSTGITADNNAAPMIVEITGIKGCPAPWIDSLYNSWNRPIPSAPPLFQRYAEWSKSEPAPATAPTGAAPAYTDPEDEVIDAGKHPWTAPQHPRLAHWLRDSKPALDRLEQATRKPRYFLPSITGDGIASAPGGGLMIHVQLPGLGSVRGLANACAARAMLHLAEDDQDGFTEDALTILRLARLLGQQPTILEQLVAVAIESMAFQVIQQAAASGLLDAPHTAALPGKIDEWPPIPTFARAFDLSERFTFLDAMCGLHHGVRDPDDKATPPHSAVALLYVVPIHYNTIFRDANAYYDSLVAAANLPGFKQRNAAFHALGEFLDAKRASGLLHLLTHFGDMMLCILGTSFEKAERYRTESMVNRDLAQVTIALHAYKLKHATYPESLSDLPPEISTTDRFTETPLTYRRTKPGYLLYSVGPDLKDDGGKPLRASRGAPYDLVVQAQDSK